MYVCFFSLFIQDSEYFSVSKFFLKEKWIEVQRRVMVIFCGGGVFLQLEDERWIF